MPWHDGGYMGGWWVVMVFMMLFWIAVIVGVVWLVVYFTRRPGGGSGTESALDILNKRYARGEVSKEEYERLKRDITDG